MKINSVNEVIERIRDRENRINNELHKIMISNKKIQELKEEKIKFNGKIRFRKDIRLSGLMWVIEIYEVKWKEFDIVDGYIVLKWYEPLPCKGCKREIEKKIYFENLLDYWEIY